MLKLNKTQLGACLSMLLLLAGAAMASDEGEKSSGKGLASILFEGASQTATYHIDGQLVQVPVSATRPMVIRAGSHVIEVHEGDVVALREELALEPGETKTLRVKEKAPE